METKKEELHDEMEKLHAEMEKMPDQMKQFTIGMRALYAQAAVGGSKDPIIVKFRELRDATRKDAIVYRDKILPISNDFMANLYEYCDYYQALEYEEWAESLDDIVEEVGEHKDLCVLLINLLDNLIVPLKKREDEAKKLGPEFKNLRKKYKENARELENSSNNNSKIGGSLAAIGLAVAGVTAAVFNAGVVPIVVSAVVVVSAVAALRRFRNIISSKHSKEQMASAVAFTEQANVLDLATLCLSETLIPALKNFLNGLNTAVEVFSTLEAELIMLLRRGETAGENPKRFHYNMMKIQTESIKKDCKAFLAVLPDIRTDLAAMPTDDMDNNYVDKWLESQMEEIKEEMFADFKALYAFVAGSLSVQERKDEAKELFPFKNLKKKYMENARELENESNNKAKREDEEKILFPFKNLKKRMENARERK